METTNQPEHEINGDTRLDDAIAMLAGHAEQMSKSTEGASFNKDAASWSTLFRDTSKPYGDAMKMLEDALKLRERLEKSYPGSGQMTIKELFIKMTDRERLSLFHERINTETPGVFDEFLKAWWMNRY
jgi:hypothetical protein